MSRLAAKDQKSLFDILCGLINDLSLAQGGTDHQTEGIAVTLDLRGRGDYDVDRRRSRQVSIMAGYPSSTSMTCQLYQEKKLH